MQFLNGWRRILSLLNLALSKEMAENVLDGIKKVFIENFIDLPDEKVDVVDSLRGQLDNMETKLNESIEENVVLSKKRRKLYQEWDRDRNLRRVVTAQREKLVSLAEETTSLMMKSLSARRFLLSVNHTSLQNLK